MSADARRQRDDFEHRIEIFRNGIRSCLTILSPPRFGLIDLATRRRLDLNG
jgi:hypothetical protein